MFASYNSVCGQEFGGSGVCKVGQLRCGVPWDMNEAATPRMLCGLPRAVGRESELEELERAFLWKYMQ